MWSIDKLQHIILEKVKTTHIFPPFNLPLTFSDTPISPIKKYEIKSTLNIFAKK